MSMSIPIDVFLSYRKQYIEPLDEIKQFIGAGWRKESNWVTTSKYTRNPWIKTERSIKTILNKISNSTSWHNMKGVIYFFHCFKKWPHTLAKEYDLAIHSAARSHALKYFHRKS